MPSWAALEWLKGAICCAYMTVFTVGAASDGTEDQGVQVPEDQAPRPDMMLGNPSTYSDWKTKLCASKSPSKVLHEDASLKTTQQLAKSSAAESQSSCRAPAVAAIAALVEAATLTQARPRAVSRTGSTMVASSLDVSKTLPLLTEDTLSPAVAAIAALVKAAATPTQSVTDSSSLANIEVLPLLAGDKLSPAVAAIAASVKGPATPTQCRSRAVSRTDSTCSLEVIAGLPPLTGDTAPAATPATAAVVVGPAAPAVLDAGAAAALQAASPAVEHTQPILTAVSTLPTAAPAASAVQPSTASISAASASSSSFTDAILSYGVASSQNSRTYQEDTAVAAMLHSSEPALSQGERFAIAAVFDGHGGAAAAEYLQQHMVSTLQEKLQQHSLNPDAALAAAVEDLESHLMAVQCSSGSTLTAIVTKDDTLYIANVGDSRAVLCRNGKAEPLTSDHKASCQHEKARIIAADPSADITADGYCYGLGVSRDLGNYQLKVNGNCKGLTAMPESSIQQLQQGDDFVVLASDGLFDVLTNTDAITTVRRALAAKPGDCTAAAQAAVDRAIALGSSDNVTAVVLLLHSRPLQLPKSNSRLFRNRSASSSSSSGASSSSISCSSSGGTCSGTAGDSSTRCQ